MPQVDNGIDEEPVVAEIHTTNPSERIKNAIEKRIGQKAGIEQITQDDSWDELIQQFSNLGEFFGVGELKVFFIDRDEPLDNIIVPGRKTTVISVTTKSPRDKILNALSQ